MATLLRSNKEVELSKDVCRLIAIHEIHRWCTLNENTTDEDFYNDFFSNQIPGFRGKEIELVDLSLSEREIMRKEIKTISNILKRRKIKILNKQ